MAKAVSIIIRTKNEERWIVSCLDAVFKQDYKDFEVILVDNKSADRTIDKAKHFNIKKIITVDEFLPGKTINDGIRSSSGKYICCLSGHCIPVSTYWLASLVRNIKKPDVAGVYGRQEPFSFSSDLDKRDMIVTFGLDKRIQTKDPFFHNANSMIKKAIWDRIPFDELVSNIEDRIWASRVLAKGYKIIYEPEASVYHYHGIHQALDATRCRKIVGILETLENKNLSRKIDAGNLNVVCVIPLKGNIIYLNGRPLLEYTLKRVLKSKYIKKIVLASDSPEYSKLISKQDKIIFLKRPPELSLDYIEIEEILKYSIAELEKQSDIPDIVVYTSITYPFRPKNLIDNMVNLLVENNFDSVVPTIPEYRSCWKEEDEGLMEVGEGLMPSKYKHPVHIGLGGLCTISYAEFIRMGARLGMRVGIYELDDLLYSVDIGKYKNLQLAEKLIGDWLKENPL